MIRSTVLFATIFLAFIGQFCLAAPSSNNDVEKLGEATKINVINDIEKYRSENPDAKIIQLQKSLGLNRKFHYTFGYHVNGEVVVAQGGDYFSYQTPQDVQQRLWYPTNGVGRRVSFVDIWVDQTSDIGSAYIVSGGIGYRTIEIIIEAKYTTLLNYVATIYGY